jgi:hypothetical protein
LEGDWPQFGKKIFPILREKHQEPSYFNRLVALSWVIPWEAGETAGAGLARQPL